MAWKELDKVDWDNVIDDLDGKDNFELLGGVNSHLKKRAYFTQHFDDRLKMRVFNHDRKKYHLVYVFKKFTLNAVKQDIKAKKIPTSAASYTFYVNFSGKRWKIKAAIEEDAIRLMTVYDKDGYDG